MSHLTWHPSSELAHAPSASHVTSHVVHTGSRWPALLGIGLTVGLYLAALAGGWPQHGAAMIVASHEAELAHLAAVEQGAHAAAAHAAAAHAADEHAADEHLGGASAAGHGHEAAHAETTPPPFATVLPFITLLGAIAVLPLVPATAHWWESNLNRFLVASGLGLLTLAYYLLLHEHPIDRHFLGHAVVAPASEGLSLALAWTVVQNAILNEYVPFITLLFSLYTISGGIRISGDLRARPETNTAIMAIGGGLASFVGTTGAAMLLIRPLLETNAGRTHVRHTVIFFIFIVCNCGGLLLPIGDPPLFLGYLQGVPFLFTMNFWPTWLMTNGLLLAIYYAWDRIICYPRETWADDPGASTARRPLTIQGLAINGPLLLGVILSVALLDPTKTFPGTDWHPWLYLREIVQLGLVGLSLLLSSEQVRRANVFNYVAIIEVAALFFGIFICMQPALQILDVHGASLGLNTTFDFFWATGLLSSVLDNAPTYLVFFKTAQSLPPGEGVLVAGVDVYLLKAISLGAVFMGAMTYIGNGPNFMVKAIAEASGVRMPSFFGYLLYSCTVLLPVLMLVTWLML